MNKRRKSRILKGVMLALALAFGIFTWCSDGVMSFALGTANVVASSGKIRESADTGSATLASVKKGDKLDVVASKTAADGYTWYKVYVNDKDTGYIRSDLVTVEGTISQEKTEEASSSKENNTDATKSESGGNKTVVGSNNSTKTEKKEDTKTEEKKEEVVAVDVNATDVATAKTNSDVRIRQGAGTQYEVAGVAPSGTEVAVSGVATDSEGKNWYQVSFDNGSKTVNGFVREDLLEVLTRVEEEPVEEEAVEEELVEEEPIVENQDYYVKYMQNDAGEMDWYLFDNLQGTSQSLTQILDVIDQVENNKLEEGKQLSTMRIIVIALAALVVILIVTVTVMIFKLRDAYEYEYEDEEEDEYSEEEDVEDEDEEEDEEEEEEEPVRKSKFGFFKKKEAVDEEEEVVEDEETLKEIQPVQPPKSKKTVNNTWQSKDFLELDDDMEFEFLDL